ncbi:hypothetical protein ABVK25_004633 [Lepraria finkii]|uniref:Fungal N-terminal domain-containing protein n=1 Tax=Lepraria finkii TaxID=1340010 RepID=A0ABR4BBU6_9LECA
MADLLSVTANIIAVIHLTASAIKCIRDLRHASKDCSEILVEICATSGILFALRDSISQARDDQTWQATIQWLGVLRMSVIADWTDQPSQESWQNISMAIQETGS